MKSPKFWLSRGLIAPQPYVPHQNSRTKGTSLGCWLAPEMIPITHNCSVLAAWRAEAHHPRVPYLGLFCDLECAEIWIFYRCTHAESDSRLLFQKWSKSVHDKWPKSRVALITKNKTRFGNLGRNPCRAISPIFLVWLRTVTPHLYSRFHPHRFCFGEVITEKHVQQAPR